jgi:hypothetical protein
MLGCCGDSGGTQYINYDLKLAFDMSVGAVSLTAKPCTIFVFIPQIYAICAFSFHAPSSPSSFKSNPAEAHTDDEYFFSGNTYLCVLILKQAKN